MLADLTLERPAAASAAPPRAYLVDQALVQDMKRCCVSQTAAGLNQQFGISWNTGRKLRKGLPIRRSVALRLVARVLAEQGADGNPMRFLSESEF